LVFIEALLFDFGPHGPSDGPSEGVEQLIAVQKERWSEGKNFPFFCKESGWLVQKSGNCGKKEIDGLMARADVELDIWHMLKK
jgi:hypothetical protein